jgi:hypothetical protein
VDVPVLERCSLAETGAPWSPLVAVNVGRDDGWIAARCSAGARTIDCDDVVKVDRGLDEPDDAPGRLKATCVVASDLSDGERSVA